MRRLHPKMERQQKKMRGCATKWKRQGKPGSWKKFIARCLKRG